MKEEKKEKHQKRQIEFEGTMELGKAVAYLEEMLQSIKQGMVAVECGEQRLTLKPSPIIQFEFEAKQKQDKETLSVELSWKDGLEVGQDAGLRISSHASEAGTSPVMSKSEAPGKRDPILFRSFRL